MAATKKIIVGVVVVIIAIGIAMNYDRITGTTPGELTGGQNVFETIVGGSQTMADVTASQWSGTATIRALLSNVGNQSSLTDGTEANIDYYEKLAGGAWNFLVVSASNSASIPVSPAHDFVWAHVDVQTSQSYYTDWQATVSANGGCNNGVGKVCNPDYADPNLDRINMYVFPIDLSTLKANTNPGITPELTWVVKFQGDQVASLSNPSSLTAVATGLVDNTIEWDLTFDHSPGAEAITEIQIRINGTDTNKWDTLRSQIILDNGQDVFTFASMVPFKDTSNTLYSYTKTYGTDVNTAEFVSVAATGTKNVNVDMIWTTNFASGDDFCMELEVTTVSARGTYTETANDIEITNDATVGDECSIADD